LVVDDCVDTVEVVCSLLGIWGHSCLGVLTGRAALDKAPEFAPEIALLDLSLPDVSGFEIARLLRASSPSMYLAAMTGCARKADRDRSRIVGFDHYLLKPVGGVELARMVDRIPTR